MPSVQGRLDVFCCGGQCDDLGQPTVLTFELRNGRDSHIGALLQAAYINDAKDTITLHFDNNLNVASTPATNAFTLSTGTVTGVSIENVDDLAGQAVCQ